MGTGSFSGVKSGRGVTLTPHPLLALCSKKGRAIPLLPLWAVRPVQSLSACTRVTFTLPFFLLGIFLSVCTCWFHNPVTLLSRFFFFLIDFGTWSYQCRCSHFIHISLHMSKCSSAHTLYIKSLYVLFFCQHWACWYAVLFCMIKLFIQNLHLLSVSVCNIFVVWYLVCNVWSCAAITSLSVSLFRPPLDSHRNMSSSLKLSTYTSNILAKHYFVFPICFLTL